MSKHCSKTAAAQQNRITYHHVGGVEHDGLVISQHGYSLGQQIAQLLSGALGAVLLDKGKYCVENDNHKDGYTQLRHARQDRQRPTA
jgi:hypothetical protein